ncbi:MAG: asparagine synthase (glutamine-hydrolyzing) [bacterium]|nr:asparagine synthase (glutamine-hydrolyzing) [bacterium]
MCGISGFVDHQATSTENILENMTHTLSHRGPDGAGTEFLQELNFQVGLGHRRLSIIDLSDKGKQPMHHKHLWITFNGEIYNYKEIKNELLSLDHEFSGGSDTEVILHAYQQWGSDCVLKFIGMFAFVIYDANADELICARDRAGIKPFFYYMYNGLFLFSSELKAFHQHPGFKKEINLDAVAAFMQYGNVPTPHCIFLNCYKLKPGHVLTYNCSTRELNSHKYWDVYTAYNKPKLQLSFDEARSETENVLKSAFNYRMVSDVPVGVFLSGGYDSTCVSALLQKDRTEKLKTFTIAVPDFGLNEAPFAKEIASYLGTEHHEFDCTEKEAFELLDDLPYYYDEPFADSSAIPTMLICKKAHEQVKVALSADGADEVFAGYNRYDYVMKFGKFLHRIPGVLRKGTSHIMDKIPAASVPFLNHSYNFANRYEKLKGLLHDPSSRNLMKSLSQQFGEKDLTTLLRSPFQHVDTAYDSKELHGASSSALSYMMAIDYQTYLMDDILQKVDRASMSTGLEARDPFLDHRISEWAAQLPDHYKYHKGVKKHLLKEIVHQYVPKKLMDRPKMGFAIPVEKWLSGKLREKVDHYLNEEKLERQGIFEVRVITHLKTDFFSGKTELGVKIWYLLMFQMWYETWME